MASLLASSTVFGTKVVTARKSASVQSARSPAVTCKATDRVENRR
jgi:hypothetical protein